MDNIYVLICVILFDQDVKDTDLEYRNLDCSSTFNLIAIAIRGSILFKNIT